MNKSLVQLIKSDLYRYHGKTSIALFLKSLFLTKGFKFVFWLRVSKYFEANVFIKWLPKLIHMYYKNSLVSDISYRTDIGFGFCLYHVFGTAFGHNVKIGNNVTLTQGVTIGDIRGESPTLGDNVYVGPGACVLGGISIGDNVVIGANAVVTKDVPDNAVVVGNPSKIISYNGSANTIENPYEIESL